MYNFSQKLILFRSGFQIGAFSHVNIELHRLIRFVVRSQNFFDNLLVFLSALNQQVINLVQRRAVAPLRADKQAS